MVWAASGMLIRSHMLHILPKDLILECRINNAGSNGYKYKTLLESSDADLVSIVETNVLGVMLGCKEARCSPAGWLLSYSPCSWRDKQSRRRAAGCAQAIRVMREQPGGGHIFNMDGAGADGNATPRFAAYGATKRGLLQLSRSLQVPTLLSHLMSCASLAAAQVAAGDACGACCARQS